jgi:hypothetical protein
MVRGQLVHVLAWASVGLSAAAHPDTNLVSSGRLANRQLLSPPSFPPYTYAGCYLDPIGGLLTGGSLLDGPTTNSTSLTYQSCATFCTGYRYFGVKNANTCQCGNTLPPTTLIPPVLQLDILCNVACSGNPNLVCGALGLVTVFRAPDVVSV